MSTTGTRDLAPLQKVVTSPRRRGVEDNTMPGVEGTMREFGKGTLRSGSKKGPVVTSKKQAIAIGLAEERKAGKTVPPKPKKKARRPNIADAIDSAMRAGKK